jgi:hypothetical protein
VQCQGADREVEAVVGKGRQLRVGRDPPAEGSRQQGRGGLGGDDALGPLPRREQARQAAGMAAEVEDDAKPPADIVKPVGQPLRDLGVQKLGASQTCRALAVEPPGAPVEHRRRPRALGRRRVGRAAAG